MKIPRQRLPKQESRSLIYILGARFSPGLRLGMHEDHYHCLLPLFLSEIPGHFRGYESQPEHLSASL